MVVLVASKKDPAGMNLARHLIEKHDFKMKGEFKGEHVFEKDNLKLVFINEDIIFAKDLPESDFYIFLSIYLDISVNRNPLIGEF